MNYNNYNTYNYITVHPTTHNMFPDANYFLENNLIKQNAVIQTKNRFVYVNQNFINANVVCTPKVLINPNFKPTVHINPNFKNPLKPSIHVNPNVIKLNKNNSVIKMATEDCSNRLEAIGIVKSKPLISTRTKLVRLPSGQQFQHSVKFNFTQSLHTKYKIVRSNTTTKNDSKHENYLKNRYKIDKNILRTKKLSRRNDVKSRYSLQNTSINRKILPTKYGRIASSKYISINGTLYKKTPNVLKKADLAKITSGKTNIDKNKVLLIRGHLYKLDHYQKRLKMLPLSASYVPKLKGKANVTMLKQKKCNKVNKPNKNKLRNCSSDIRSLTNQILRSKMQKCNLPCPIYRKFGRCKANEAGKCIRVHNPDQISLCTKFLQGACINPKCLLSHRVSPEKMPTCKYFLEGLCTKEDCVYLHVKISAKAEICKDFLEGYCKKAKECLKRHQFLCPDYEKSGSCPRKRCQYPHGDAVRKTKYSNKVAKRICKKKTSSKLKMVETATTGEIEQHDKNVRYYAENSEECVTNVKAAINTVQEGLNNENIVNDTEYNGNKSRFLKRFQLGVLPSFIPFGETNSNPCESKT